MCSWTRTGIHGSLSPSLTVLDGSVVLSVHSVPVYCTHTINIMTLLNTLYFQALANGFFNFDTFDVDEYEHYEVSSI